MQIQKQTKLSTSLTHDEIVAFLALGVKVQAGIVPSAPGSSATVTLQQADGAGQFSAEVVILIDHAADDSAGDQASTSIDPVAPVATQAQIVIPTGLGGLPTA